MVTAVDTYIIFDTGILVNDGIINIAPLHQYPPAEFRLLVFSCSAMDK